MRARLEFGSGAKWSLLLLQLAFLLNPYLVTDAANSGEYDIVQSESRSPYVYLNQREYVVKPNGDYEEVRRYPKMNATASPPGTLKRYTTQLKELQSSEELGSDQDGSETTTQRFENQYTRYSYGLNDEENEGQESSNSPSSIQDVLSHKQGGYYSGAPASSYDSVQYQSPLVSYEVPSNYFPNEHFQWPSSYSSGGIKDPLPFAPFLAGVGQLTSSVKQVQAQIGEQKAKTAFQVADLVKNTGDAVTNAIHNKGHAAAAVVGQTVQTAGEVLKTKGATATRLIQGTGNLASSAVQSVGNIGGSILRAKGELVGAVIKTGAAIGTSALGTASNALAGGTALVRAKGDAASNIINKGGRLASGVIGTKGRLISSVINAKGQFAANLIEAKGRAAASLLETGGQKLNELAEAIKSATAQKQAPPPSPFGWSEPASVYAAPVGKIEAQKVEEVAQLVQEEPPVTAHHQSQQYHQDYADSYYDPRDTYGRLQRSSKRQRSPVAKAAKVQPPSVSNLELETDDNTSRDQDEDFQNEYSAYYPHHHSIRPHTDYYSREQW